MLITRPPTTCIEQLQTKGATAHDESRIHLEQASIGVNTCLYKGELP